MNTIVGVIVLFGSIIGGFIGEGGNLLAVVQPYEVLIIGGAAGGAFIVTNPFYIIKQVMGKLGVLIKGSKYKKQLYMDSLAMLFELLNKARMQGLLALESDIEDPANSPIFTKYPQLTSDHHILDFISDYLRLMVSGTMNPIEIESLMDVELETHHHESALPSEAWARWPTACPPSASWRPCWAS